MLTITEILKELKNVPAERLEDIYSIIFSLSTNTKKSESANQEILSFAGSFSNMTESDYADYLKQTKNTRNELFDRDIKL